MDISTISISHILIAFIPVFMVAFIAYFWLEKIDEIAIAVLRMATQLLLIGYVLTWIFEQKNIGILGVVVLVMSLVSTWIALRHAKDARKALYLKTMGVIMVCSLFVLGVIVIGVLSLNPAQNLRIVIPLAGMVFSNAMTAIGLASERYFSALNSGINNIQARNQAFNASLIPIINAMLAVGLVALPGMMTGQILSGISPLIAVRYQIVVMCMIFGVVGLSSAGFLYFIANDSIVKRLKVSKLNN